MNNISFIVPAYNSTEFLKDAVSSIYDQNFETGDEVIIVDDCSNDNTLEVAYDLQSKHSNLKIIKHKINHGSGIAGVNTGIENAENDLIFVLDHDNVLIPGTVPKLKEFLLTDQLDAAAFQDILFFRDKTRPSDTFQVWKFKEGEIFLADVFAGHIWPGPDGNYLFTKQSWLKAGRCNEFVSPAMDCWAFGFKQLVTGSRMGVMPNSGYYHRVGINSQWMTFSQLRNLSLIVLEIIIPHIDLFEESDVDYMFSKEGRSSWFDHIKSQPIKLKNQALGQGGLQIIIPEKKSLFDKVVANIVPPIFLKIVKQIH